jgi:very-short-patch-repair endonuclease
MDWGEQFDASLRRYYSRRASGPDGTLRTAVERSIATTAGFTTLSPTTAAAFIKAVAEQQIRFETVTLIDELQATCESPIELAMGLALWIAAREETDAVRFIINGHTHGTGTGASQITVQPQATIEPYRVDFLLTATQAVDAFPIHSFPSNPFQPAITRKMVLECDGRDFHDRLQTQAVRDRQRDRDLQARGYLAFRYAGTEIWGDVFQCASEAVTVLTSSQVRRSALA